MECKDVEIESHSEPSRAVFETQNGRAWALVQAACYRRFFTRYKSVVCTPYP